VQNVHRLDSEIGLFVGVIAKPGQPQPLLHMTHLLQIDGVGNPARRHRGRQAPNGGKWPNAISLPQGGLGCIESADQCEGRCEEKITLRTPERRRHATGGQRPLKPFDRLFIAAKQQEANTDPLN
jgi:hypothetical protein